MNSEDNILIIPDVHGRDFWKKCKEFSGKIIFLGDYLDPYPFEYEEKDGKIVMRYKDYDYKELAVENFKEILEFANANKDRVIMLYGNHDLHYVNFYFNSSRRDDMRKDDIKKLFIDNRDLFKIAHIEGNVLFTHAGVCNEWLDAYANDYMNMYYDDIAVMLNDMPLKTLLKVGYYRGGYDMVSGPEWLDVCEIAHGDDKDSDKVTMYDEYVQIFSHTMNPVKGDIITHDLWAMVDNRVCNIVNPYLEKDKVLKTLSNF